LLSLDIDGALECLEEQGWIRREALRRVYAQRREGHRRSAHGELRRHAGRDARQRGTPRLRRLPDPTDITARERLVMTGVGLRLIREHPLAGVGPGGVKHVYPRVVPPEGRRRATSHLHNTPLQIAVERGLVGLAAWLWLFVAFFRGVRVALAPLPADAVGDRALVLGSTAAIVTFLVAGLFEDNFGDTEVLMVALAAMAVPFALTDRSPSSSASSRTRLST
jgi:O-Antigen ligase